MAHNLECKVRLRSFATARKRAQALGANRVAVLRQKDTFLTTAPERMKVRETRGNAPELIFYERADGYGENGAWSHYLRVPMMSARNILMRYDGGIVTVEKTRELYMFKNARIHLDRVKGLGSFLEFEVVSAGRRAEDRTLFCKLMSAFGIEDEDIVPTAYADLLLNLRR